MYGVLISPYPYSKPDEIWAPGIRNAKNPNQGRGVYKGREVVAMRELPALGAVMATSPEGRILKGDRGPEKLHHHPTQRQRVPISAVDPILGRTVLLSDIRADGQAEPVIVLSFKAWQKLFEAATTR